MLTAEQSDAKSYWSTHHIQSTQLVELDGNQRYRVTLANRIMGLKPDSVMEFGCNVGRNLRLLRELGYDRTLFGYEQSGRAVEIANERLPDLDIRLGDETTLKTLPSESVDLVFTLSVLDHNWDWTPIYDDLKRITRKHLILIEPQLETEYGIFEGSLNGRSDAVPYTYSWDYQRYDPDIKREDFRDIENNVFPHFSTLYKLFHLAK